MRPLRSPCRAGLLLFTLLAACTSEHEVERDVALGRMLGVERRGVERFLGIPYAEPPIGDLRWRPPQALTTPWGKPLDARRFSSACVQGATPSMAQGSQEDCLYLNVWAPSGGRNRPVMVWIHGGGQMLGSANEPAYDGEALARAQDVVVVSLNFRLSWLGFLAFDGVAGNQGFLDQVAALRWVQQNIARFGGDPQRVTLFGESGGGVATCLLLASPLTAGLIHAAIMQSGTCGIQHVMSDEEAQAQARGFIEKVGCGSRPDPSACARTLSVEQIEALGYTPHSLLATDTKAFSYYPLAVKDGHFLTADPMDLLRAADAKRLPILIGTTLDEGSLFTGQLDFPDSAEAHRENLERTIPGAAEEMTKLYPWNRYPSIGKAYSEMFADAMEHCPANRVGNLWAGRNPVYQYLFTQSPSAPLIWLMSLRAKSGAADPGVFHGSEIPYVFGVNSMVGYVWRRDQKAARSLVMTYWANFARSGNPNGSGVPQWPAHTLNELRYIELSNTVEARSALRAETCAFWDRHAGFSYW